MTYTKVLHFEMSYHKAQDFTIYWGVMKRPAVDGRHQPVEKGRWSTSTVEKSRMVDVKRVEKCSLHFSTWSTLTILHLSTVNGN